MKKIRLFVCLFASGSKEHRFKNSLIVTNDGWDLVGPWVIEVRESEFEYKSGSKVKITSTLVTPNRCQMIVGT